LVGSLQETYGELLRERPIQFTLNGQLIEPGISLYTHPLCVPFTKTWTIYKNKVYFIQNGEEYEVYDKELLKKRDRASLATLLEGAVECGTIQTTMTKYYYDQEGGELPYNSIHLYRNKRCYGRWDHTYKTRNGAKNYVQSRIDLRGKELAKLLGLTFNKSISDEIVNTETEAFKEFIRHVTKEFNTDRNSPLYAKMEDVAKRAGLVPTMDRATGDNPVDRLPSVRGPVPETARHSIADYIRLHPEIADDKELKALWNHMMREKWIPRPDYH
jgi:hypothetical protein